MAAAEAAPEALPPALAERRREARDVDHLRALLVQTPASLAGNAVGMVLITAMFAPLASPWRLGPWLGAGIALWLLRLAHHLLFHRRRDADDATVLRLRRGWRALVLAQGALWGVAAWLFWGLGEPYHRLALLLIVYTYCLGSVQLLSTQFGVFLAFISLVLVPTIVRVATDATQPWHWPMAGILTLLFIITVLMARTAGSALAQAITLKSHTDAMAVQLREQRAAAEAERQAAEAARRAAEAANRAKTQFFAAASHDLRQPLHALGLFAEALRQRTHDPEAAALVGSINESVDALEGLFAELLDITRIDTGAVEVRPAPVPLGELFARLRLQFEPLAFEKGLQLTLRDTTRVVQADPVLLERILRNLVSNAIRYTDDGGVLVAARPAGDRVRIEVRDSGIGIPAASLPRIYDEFFQAHEHRALPPHQRKGLGLGLAIVKRLADLSGAALDVRSRVGRGTVFALTLPRGTGPRPAPAEAPAAALGLSLQGRRLLVVEDDGAVREGLVVLLKAWGATVDAFETVADLERWLEAPSSAGAWGDAPPPDLLLVDHRLPQGRSGVEALALARARWPERRLPAILITGSTMGGHEAAAAEHDYHLLIKPVLPARLRAMVAFKLGAAPANRRPGADQT